DHFRPFGVLEDAAAIEVFTVLRDRVATHLERGRAAAVAIFNHKRAAGASLPHPHAQVLATDFVPPAIVEAVARVRQAGTDLVLEDAGHDEALTVVAGGPALTWCPYASSAPYQIRVAPEHTGAHFEDAGDDELASVAIALRDALACLSSALDDPSYNVVVHSAPPGGGPFHWYVEVIPRLAVIAGFELATGLFVNTFAPDQAAKILRAARR
ncbi:MAG: hypothetical protein WEB19_03030, partial [Acidimicrobiia bacterium]